MKQHGMYGGPEYKAWSAMIQRCFNSNSPNFKYYGARGITVCPEWRESFERFYANVGPRPEGTFPSGTALYSIDRLDNNKGYFPGNVAWRTSKQQNRNRRAQYSCTDHDIEDYSALVDWDLLVAEYSLYPNQASRIAICWR